MIRRQRILDVLFIPSAEILRCDIRLFRSLSRCAVKAMSRVMVVYLTHTPARQPSQRLLINGLFLSRPENEARLSLVSGAQFIIVTGIQQGLPDEAIH